MKKTRGLLLLTVFSMVFLLLLATRVHAFFPTKVDASHNPELSGKLTEVIGTHWFERKEKILTGQDPLGKAELKAIYEAQLDRGIKNIPLLSSLLLRESLRALHQNDVERAEFLCQYAQKYSPDLPSAYFAMARIHWSRSKTTVNLVLREYVRGVYAIFANFRESFFRSLNILYLVSGAALLVFIAFTVIMGLKYLSLYLYDVKKEFDLAPWKFLVGVVKVVAFVVPVLLHLNLLWTLFYWAILMWGYMARREREMMVIFLFVLVFIPWVLDETTDFLEKPDPNVLMTVHQANQTTWSENTKRSLRKWNQERPEDADVLFTLGFLNKRDGNYEEAKRYYDEALQNDPEWAECISNLGNVYLSTGRREEAVEQYEQAIALSPKQASFYFNLHRAFARESILSTEMLEQALDTATELNPRLVAFHTLIFSESANRAIIDDTISAGRLWARVFGSLKSQYDLPEVILRPWMRGVSGKYYAVSPVFFLAFLILFSLLCLKKNFPKRCPMCGTPSVKFIPRRIQGDAVCFGCNRLFVRKESIDPKMKEKRMKQVSRFERRKGILWRVLSFILPGGGHLWKGQSMKGSLIVFFFFILGLKYFYWNGIVRDSVVLGGPPAFWVRVVFILFFLVFYLGVLRSSLRIES